MIPWAIVGVFVGTALLFLVVAVVLLRFGTLNKGVPLPVVGLIVVLMLGGGIAYVASTLREPKRERREEEPTEGPAGAANMATMMSRGMAGGGGVDRKRPLVDMVQRLDASARDGSLELAEGQRDKLTARLHAIANAEVLGLIDANIHLTDLRQIFTEEQLQHIQSVQIERADPSVNFSADLSANPFRDGTPKQVLDALIAWTVRGGG